MHTKDIPTLRERIVTTSVAGHTPCSPSKVISGQARILPKTENITPWQKRQGVNVRKKLEKVRFDSSMGINLAGWQGLEPEITPEEESIFKKHPLAGGQTGHCQPYYDDILNIGIDGIKEKIAKRLSSANEQETTTLESFI